MQGAGQSLECDMRDFGCGWSLGHNVRGAGWIWPLERGMGRSSNMSVSGTRRVRWRVHVAAGTQPRMAEAPRQSLGHNMQRFGCKRSWRHGFGYGSGGSTSVAGT
jgi:hypothetical protein